jgi:hypothetical protein
MLQHISHRSPAELRALRERLNLVDPTDRGHLDSTKGAPRLPTLAGARIALLENRKPNARELLDTLAGLLIERGQAGAADVRSKFIYSRPAAADIVDELVQYDAVVTAIGD